MYNNLLTNKDFIEYRQYEETRERILESGKQFYLCLGMMVGTGIFSIQTHETGFTASPIFDISFLLFTLLTGLAYESKQQNIIVGGKL